MKKIYLAGPEVFLPNAVEVGNRLKSLCKTYGFEGCFPLDNTISGTNAKEIAQKIREANIAMIKACDAVIANVSSFRGAEPDSGTVWEIGYAQALNKEVIAYATDRRTLKTKTQEILQLGNTGNDAQGMAIEDFGLSHNLMYAQCVLAGSFEECLAYLKMSRV